MKKTFGLVLAGALALSLMGTRVYANDMKHDGKHEKSHHKEVKAKAKRYEVVDVSCYVTKGMYGPKNRECAKKCINGGGELALLRGGDLFVPVDKDYKSARNRFNSKGGEMVEVVGKSRSKGGVNYLVVEEVRDARMDRD